MQRLLHALALKWGKYFAVCRFPLPVEEMGLPGSTATNHQILHSVQETLFFPFAVHFCLLPDILSFSSVMHCQCLIFCIALLRPLEEILSTIEDGCHSMHIQEASLLVAEPFCVHVASCVSCGVHVILTPAKQCF